MTDRQTIIDLFEKHADWHNDLAWIEVGAAADLIVDLEDAPHRDDAAMAAISGILYVHAKGGVRWQGVLGTYPNDSTAERPIGEKE